MFVLKVFLFVSITFYFVNTQNSECAKRNLNDTVLKSDKWFEEDNSDTSTLIKMINCKHSPLDKEDVLFVLFEVKENGTLRRFEYVRNSYSRSTRLQHLKIEIIEPGAFETISNLTEIRLSSNKLKIIKNGIFNDIKGLKNLFLTDNEISTIEENAFDNMPDIQDIYLNRNKISKLNGNWFSNSPKIKLIAFDDNEIEEIEVNSFKNLRGARFDSNGEQIGIGLHFDDNKINKIHPDAFKGIPIISYLSLRGNALKELPKKLFEETKVQLLDTNNIPCLPKKAYESARDNKNIEMCE